jgi:hypothetical protein
MNRYLVVSPHEPLDCVKALKQIEAIGSITHFEWGCKDGEHCGWAIVEADSTAEALLIVPSFERHRARAIRLVQFSPEDIRRMHL